MKSTSKLILLAIIDCIIAISGFSLFWIATSADNFGWLEQELPYPGLMLAIASMVLALVTFFGLLAASESSGKGWGYNKGSMRGAIAATILVVYFYVLSMNAFQPYRDKMPEMMETMVSSFTTILGIMIPFYFGASAYVQTHTTDADTKKEPTAPTNQ
jgi:hypothetical protein